MPFPYRLVRLGKLGTAQSDGLTMAGSLGTSALPGPAERQAKQNVAGVSEKSKPMDCLVDSTSLPGENQKVKRSTKLANTLGAKHFATCCDGQRKFRAKPECEPEVTCV